MDGVGARARIGMRLAVGRARDRAKNNEHVARLPGLQLWHAVHAPTAIVVPVPGRSLVYVPVPKVACSSIKFAIATHVGLEADVHHEPWPLVPVRRLPVADSWSFAFVRDPLDRLLSCYREKILAFRQPDRHTRPLDFWKFGDRFDRDMGFADFVHAVAAIPDRIADPHFRSQHTFLHADDRPRVDFVGRMERMEEDWDEVRRVTGLPALPTRNVTASGREDPWTRDLARVAARRYARDIQLYGYGDVAAALVGPV